MPRFSGGIAVDWAGFLTFTGRNEASPRRAPETMNGRFYEDSFVKPFLMSASIDASWAPHEGVADAS